MGGIILFLGIYFLAKAYGWDKSFEEYVASMKTSLVEGRFSFILYVTSAILLLVGLIQGVNSSIVETVAYRAAVLFIFSSVWWFVLSGIFIALAKAADAYAEGRRVSKYISIVFLLISLGFVVWGASNYILHSEAQNAIQSLAIYFGAAIFVAVIGVLPLRRI